MRQIMETPARSASGGEFVGAREGVPAQFDSGVNSLENSAPCRSVMVVEDKGGCLIPLWTAGDLLRACKRNWQTAEKRQ
jgi:hypothetical protein